MKKMVFNILVMIVFFTGLISITLHFHNKHQARIQQWKPLIESDKNIPQTTNERLTLFYKSNDLACGLSLLAEVSNEDREGREIVEDIIVLLDKQLLKFGWHETDYTQLPSKRNYALTIIHSKNGVIEINIKVNDRLYRKKYDAENSDFMVSEVITRLFGVEA